MTVGLCVLAGIVAFLVVEKMVRIYGDGGHGHSHGPAAKDDNDDGAKGDAKKKKNADKKKKKAKSSDDEEADEDVAADEVPTSEMGPPDGEEASDD